MVAKDIISRDTLKRLTTDLARQLLGLDGEAVELLETQNQRIEDRRADLVARMRTDDNDEFLLHAEIANNNRAGMPLRMLRYYTDIRFAGHTGAIRQYLIYIGSAPLGMSAGIQEPDLLEYRYTIVDMHQVHCTGLLVQDNPRRTGLGRPLRLRRATARAGRRLHRAAPEGAYRQRRQALPRVHGHAGDPLREPRPAGAGPGGRKDAHRD
jgi:hypothetical protein